MQGCSIIENLNVALSKLHLKAQVLTHGELSEIVHGLLLVGRQPVTFFPRSVFNLTFIVATAYLTAKIGEHGDRVVRELFFLRPLTYKIEVKPLIERLQKVRTGRQELIVKSC